MVQNKALSSLHLIGGADCILSTTLVLTGWVFLFFYCWLEMLHSFLSVKILHRIAVKLQWQLQTFLHAQLMHLCQLVIHVHLQDAGSKCLLIGQEGKVAILPMRQRKGWCKLWNVFLFCKLSKPSAVDCFHAATGCCIEEQCFEWSSGAG